MSIHPLTPIRAIIAAILSILHPIIVDHIADKVGLPGIPLLSQSQILIQQRLRVFHNRHLTALTIPQATPANTIMHHSIATNQTQIKNESNRFLITPHHLSDRLQLKQSWLSVQNPERLMRCNQQIQVGAIVTANLPGMTVDQNLHSHLFSLLPRCQRITEPKAIELTGNATR